MEVRIQDLVLVQLEEEEEVELPALLGGLQQDNRHRYLTVLLVYCLIPILLVLGDYGILGGMLYYFDMLTIYRNYPCK